MEYSIVDLIRDVNDESQKFEEYYFDSQKYLVECHKYLERYLSTYEGYLFSSITYLDENNTVTFTPYHFNQKAKDCNIDDTINELLVSVKDKRTAISVTEQILGVIKRSIFLIKGNRHNFPERREFGNKVKEFHLDTFKYELSFTEIDFFENNIAEILKFKDFFEIHKKESNERVSNLLYYYCKIAHLANTQEIFFYFFKPPLFKGSPKDGLLSMCTTKHVNDTERIAIYLIVYRILAEISFEKIKKLNDVKEITKTIYGLGHFIKNRVSRERSELDEIMGGSAFQGLADEQKKTNHTSTQICPSCRKYG